MLDIWAIGQQTKPGLCKGAWMCPDAELYGKTVESDAPDMVESYRTGIAMAILSVFQNLDENIRVHIPEGVFAGWLIFGDMEYGSNVSPYRVIYRTKVVPAVAAGKVSFHPQGTESPYFKQLRHVINRKEGIKGCTLFTPTTSTK